MAEAVLDGESLLGRVLPSEASQSGESTAQRGGNDAGHCFVVLAVGLVISEQAKVVQLHAEVVVVGVAANRS